MARGERVPAEWHDDGVDGGGGGGGDGDKGDGERGTDGGGEVSDEDAKEKMSSAEEGCAMNGSEVKSVGREMTKSETDMTML